MFFQDYLSISYDYGEIKFRTIQNFENMSFISDKQEPKAVSQRCSTKTFFFKSLQNFQENLCARFSSW